MCQVAEVMGSEVQVLLDAWTVFQQSFPEQIKEGRLTKSMCWGAAGQRIDDANHHYGRKRRLVVAGDAGGVIHGAAIIRDDNISSQIEWIGVLADMRRCGVGSELVEHEKRRVSGPWNRRRSLLVGVFDDSDHNPRAWCFDRPGVAEFYRQLEFSVLPVNTNTIAVFEAEDYQL